jgi:hypothetical protein
MPSYLSTASLPSLGVADSEPARIPLIGDVHAPHSRRRETLRRECNGRLRAPSRHLPIVIVGTPSRDTSVTVIWKSW